jgi:thiosulfate/3-mercaptopyruvate sulfurtransferase
MTGSLLSISGLATGSKIDRMSTKPLYLLLAAVPFAFAAPHPEMLVSTEWLGAHLKDPSVVILHVARNRADYDGGHIPGAQYVPWSELTITRNGIPAELPPAADLAKLFERCGVTPQARIVLYGDFAGLSAARAYFTLDYLGLAANAALLDGGIEKWRAEERPITKDVAPAPQGHVEPKLNPEIVVSLEEMEALSKKAAAGADSGVVIVDSRPPDDYAGKTADKTLPRLGHIPGAQNVFWADAIRSAEMPALLPAAEVRRIYSAAGVTEGSTVITYCKAGVQAAYGYFTLKYLGFKARMYDGSFAEWSRVQEAPVAAGARARQ